MRVRVRGRAFRANRTFHQRTEEPGFDGATGLLPFQWDITLEDRHTGAVTSWNLETGVS